MTRKYRRTIAFVAFLASAGIGDCRSASVEQATPLEDVVTVLRLLPADTETVIVARGVTPFFAQDGARLDLRDACSATTVVNLPKGAQELFEDGVDLAVEGAREFAPPTSLGIARYEGCTFLWVSARTRERLLAWAQRQAEQTIEESGAQVFVVRQKREEDTWSYYITFEKAFTMIATNRMYLREVLNAMKQGAKGSMPRAWKSGIELTNHPRSGWCASSRRRLANCHTA